MVLESLSGSFIGVVPSFNISCLGRFERRLLSNGLSSSLSLFLEALVRFIVFSLSKEVDSSDNFTVLGFQCAVIHMVGTIELVPLGIPCLLLLSNDTLVISQIISS